MRKIPMLDLAPEMEEFQADIDRAIQVVMKSGRFINGEEVNEFERDFSTYLNVDNVVSCANGTDALQIALMASGLEKGDGVITTPFTFFATAEVISLLGMDVQFVDIKEDTFNLDPALIEDAIQPHTKAIMPVHLFGQTADMKAIMDIADKHDLIVIEDSAQATGGKYKMMGEWMHNGTMGDIGCTSFFPSKNLACYGDGGALFMDDKGLAEKGRMLKSHGSRKKYVNEVVGMNSRLDTIQAAILKIKLKQLDRFNESRRTVARCYRNALSNIEELTLPRETQNAHHVYHQFTIRVSGGQRDALREFLNEKGISTAIYYHKPLHLQKALAYLSYKNGDFPVAEKSADAVLSLPVHPYLEEKAQDFIINTVRQFYQ